MSTESLLLTVTSVTIFVQQIVCLGCAGVYSVGVMQNGFTLNFAVPVRALELPARLHDNGWVPLFFYRS